jgi:cobalt-zinc-cadmium efflux system outer membrane protein
MPSGQRLRFPWPFPRKPADYLSDATDFVASGGGVSHRSQRRATQVMGNSRKRKQMRRLPARCLRRGLWITVGGCLLLVGACKAPSQWSRQESHEQVLTRVQAGLVRPSVAANQPWRGQETAPQQGETAAQHGETARQEDRITPASFAETSDAAPPEPPAPADRPVEATAGATMTVEQALEYALGHHPLLRARQHEVEAARARLITAGLLPNPRFVLNTGSPLDREGPTDLLGRLEFTILTGGKRRLREAAAEAGIQRTRLALDRETEQVLAEAADAAVEVLYLQELTGLQSQLSEMAAKTAALHRDRFKAGQITYAATILSALDAGNVEMARLGAQGLLELARVRLSRAIGLPPSERPSVQGQLDVEAIPPVPLEKVLAQAERSRPELAESRAALRESQQRLAVAEADARPDIVLGARLRTTLGERGNDMGGRFETDVPVFDRNQGRIAEGAAMVGTSRAMVDVTKIATLSDVAAAYLELRATQSRLELYQTHVRPAAEDAEKTIREARAEEVLTPSRISELLEQLVRVRVQHLDLRYRHDRLRTRLEILLGRPLRELQEEAPAPSPPSPPS